MMQGHATKKSPHQAIRRGFSAALSVSVLVFMLFVRALPGGTNQFYLPDKEVKVGFTANVFPDVDQRDVQAAMQLWTKQLARGMGMKAEPRTVIFNKTEDLVAAVNRGEMILVSLPALDYLKIRKAAAMSPAIVTLKNSGNKRRFLLVTRRDSGIKTVRDLRKKSLILPSRKKQTAGHIWLEVLLLEKGIPESLSICKETREIPSASQALMAVFFRRYDAAVVNRSALETCVALNPQLASQLVVIAESDTLLGDVTCIPNNVKPDLQRTIEHAALHLHESTVGRQMFTMFQMDQAVLYKPSHLAGLEALLRERDRLKARNMKKR